MGLFDDMTLAVNRGAAAAGRTGRVARLRVKLSDLNRQRTEAAARLGSSLYETTKDMPSMRSGREGLYDAIAQLDERRAQVQSQIEEIELEARAAQDAARTYACPHCGARVYGSQGFCSGCGASLADIRSAAGSATVDSDASTGLACVWCGAPLAEGDLYCMSCGARQSEDAAAE